MEEKEIILMEKVCVEELEQEKKRKKTRKEFKEELGDEYWLYTNEKELRWIKNISLIVVLCVSGSAFLYISLYILNGILFVEELIFCLIIYVIAMFVFVYSLNLHNRVVIKWNKFIDEHNL